MYQLKKGDVVVSEQTTPFEYVDGYWQGDTYTAYDPFKTRFTTIEVNTNMSTYKAELGRKASRSAKQGNLLKAVYFEQLRSA